MNSTISRESITKVKKFFGAKKAGHAGTLDLIPTGALVICLNQATKISRFLLDLDKEYIVKMKLGEKTDTGDLTGKVIEKRNSITLKEIDILWCSGKFYRSDKTDTTNVFRNKNKGAASLQTCTNGHGDMET